VIVIVVIVIVMPMIVVRVIMAAIVVRSTRKGGRNSSRADRPRAASRGPILNCPRVLRSRARHG
jgi:hypothetical protein